MREPPPIDPNRRTVESFYAAFAARDGEAMAGFYHPDASFADPAFGELTGAQAGQMWRALMRGAKDFSLSFSIGGEQDGAWVVDWIARYTFSKTGRPVENKVRSRLWLRDGLIARQRDDFDFHRWAGQAFGFVGKLLGGFSFFQNAVRKKARAAARLG